MPACTFFSPTVDLDAAEHNGPMKIRVACFALILSTSATGCYPQSREPLEDGCYYVGTVPVLRVTGVQGDLLIPGTVSHVRVTADTSSYQPSVTFEPGFYILSGSPLKVERNPELPESTFLIKQFTGESTIVAVAEPTGSLDLVKGKRC